MLNSLLSLAHHEDVANTDLIVLFGEQPCDTSWLNWGDGSAEGFSLYVSVDPWVWWKQQWCNTLEGVISCSSQRQLGTVPDSSPTPHVSLHLNPTADPEHPESLTRWQRRWGVEESLPHVTIYLTNTAHTPKATILQQPWSVPASCLRREGGTMLIDFSFFSEVKLAVSSFVLECLVSTFWYIQSQR